MYKINLIRGWKKSEIYRSYRSRWLIIMVSVTVFLLLFYLGLFIRFVLFQKELTTLSNKQYVTETGHEYTTEELTKALYGLKKLDQIKIVYSAYPEYYLYHQFLLNHIYQFDSFIVDNYKLDREHEVEVTLSTSKLDDIYKLINLLESPKVIKYFSLLEIRAINSVIDKKTELVTYKIDFILKFNELLFNEQAKI
ncbi:hypothetical protein A2313_03680 [Candidatus Roizmanbacteria bacterium RIFOXYB2_FULL_41_10]|uniref:Uncharacterized protein n=1 Tax=Candidatus Roizmanbacteria bacterium RIFOXYA1_FULL_41_12 TaxID=1802082 RepID=A0A1F7KEN2_9BACT|nr:MAG: hypothetical protein A2209_01990 [Candidatus Roizmanbacteria bacterium RIFOXYA1_FULL_41_12]OGK66650.1 MAG: hypothetical protein A2262_01600 [Candidatus Roizmanbacteria bacterium RIFOXYA2_FULL_41_8]OGK67108.1 MAG: hypothetical protein A2377_00375 [Candidatus Roizmanbacteria bacterium RIFOXYB1_FULL_41_27]OGK69031.1 MAG: hypothetical protein A2313_03680 [Candidatus Roizmanbacteria bacterium RIFOXYB2_FULL_41_10]OGK71512.1 MAG: hypothetical protein A2403_00715 [Candidatus Roizmanbacteria bac